MNLASILTTINSQKLADDVLGRLRKNYARSVNDWDGEQIVLELKMDLKAVEMHRYIALSQFMETNYGWLQLKIKILQSSIFQW